MCEICSKLTIKIPKQRGVFIVNFEHISHLVLIFLKLMMLTHKNIIDVVVVSLLFTWYKFRYYYGVSIVKFEQVNDGYVTKLTTEQKFSTEYS